MSILWQAKVVGVKVEVEINENSSRSSMNWRLALLDLMPGSHQLSAPGDNLGVRVGCLTYLSMNRLIVLVLSMPIEPQCVQFLCFFLCSSISTR